jgi:RHS repeat-associated protein
MLAQANGPDMSVVPRYDSLSRPHEVIETIAGRNYKSESKFDELGRIKQAIYPSGFAVDYHYGAVSELTEIRPAGSQKVLWKLEELYPTGEVRRYKLGNGSTVHRNRDERTDRVTSDTATAADLSSLVAKSYEHDSNGNLESREDRVTGITESFTYDALDRLQTFTGPSLKTIVMDYDSIGRIKSRSDVGTYEYGSGCAGGIQSPFVPKKIGAKSFCTDGKGNIVNAGRRTLNYNADDLPLEVREGKKFVRFAYGIGGKLLSREDLNGSSKTLTRFVGDNYETVESADDVVQRHYVGDFLVVETEGTEYREHYLYKDYLGSTLAAADQNGRIMERFDYDPYGQRRDQRSLNWVDGIKPSTTTRGFTGHEQIDAMNLIHMKGRIYDPTIGLFLTPDPYVQDLTATQNLNRYTYVMNNPLSYNDPTGHFFSSKTLKHWGRQISNVGKGISSFVSNPGRFISNNWEKARTWTSSSQNQRLIMSIAITVAASSIGPGSQALWYQQMAYSAAVGYTSSYVASGGDSKAALNGAVTGAAFSLVGVAFQGMELKADVRIGKVLAHGMVGGASSLAAGGRFESGFRSAGLSQAIGQGLDASGYGFSANPKGWDYASNAALAAVVGGTVSSSVGGSFEHGALTAALGRLLNDSKHLGEEPGLEDGTPFIGKAVDMLGDMIEKNIFGTGSCVELGSGASFCPSFVGGSVKAVGSVVVIGEGMSRIKDAVRMLRSEGVNAKWYQAWGKNFSPENFNLARSITRNERWLLSKIDQGYKIYDIGLDSSRTVRSPFYQSEKRLLEKYNYPITPIEWP